MKKGRNGLVTLVTPCEQSYEAQVRGFVQTWLNEFRIAGLDSWRLRHAKGTDAGRMLVMNYAASIHFLLGDAVDYVTEDRLELFRWYRKHLSDLVPAERADEMNAIWCQNEDIAEIKQWCQAQGYLD